VAQSIKQIQNYSVAFSSENIARGVARAEDRILMMEAEVQANNEYPGNAGVPAAIHYDSNIDDEVEQELQKLKEEAKQTV
jgi:phage shock protein A